MEMVKLDNNKKYYFSKLNTVKSKDFELVLFHFKNGLPYVGYRDGDSIILNHRPQDIIDLKAIDYLGWTHIPKFLEEFSCRFVPHNSTDTYHVIDSCDINSIKEWLLMILKTKTDGNFQLFVNTEKEKTVSTNDVIMKGIDNILGI